MLTCADFLLAPRSSALTRIKSSLSPEHGRHLRPGADWRFAGVGSAKISAGLESADLGSFSNSPWKERSSSFPLFPLTRSGRPEGADLCVLCTPIGAMPSLAQRIAPALSSSATVTDVGSVKAGVVRRLEAILGGRFVGSHPMAGSEQSGFDAARANLFEGAVCIVTPTPQLLSRDPREPCATFGRAWDAVSWRCLPRNMTNALRASATFRMPSPQPSSMPSTCACRTLARSPAVDTVTPRALPQLRPRCGGKFFSRTRAELVAGLEDFSTTLDKMKQMILSRDAAALELFLERAKSIRENLAMSTDVFRVRRAPKLETEITVPGDKSISHRAIMLAALSNGVCKITNFLEGGGLFVHGAGVSAIGRDHRNS